MATNATDWFNSDSAYRTSANNSLAALTAQLASLMSTRNTDYQNLATQQTALNQNRQNDLTTLGGDVANRGLQDSGLYAQSADKTGQAYAVKQAAQDSATNQIQQQYGAPNVNINTNTLAGQANNGFGNLSSTYGLLGQLGVNAGNAYNSAISAAKQASAARSAAPLTAWS